MKLSEVLSADDKLTLVKFKTTKKKKNNPIKSKTTKMNSFIDVFGSMAGYSEPRTKGSVNPTASGY